MHSLWGESLYHIGLYILLAAALVGVAYAVFSVFMWRRLKERLTREYGPWPEKSGRRGGKFREGVQGNG